MLWTEMVRFSELCFLNFQKFITLFIKLTKQTKCSPSYKIFTFIFLVATYIYQDNCMSTKSPEKKNKMIQKFHTDLV